MACTNYDLDTSSLTSIPIRIYIKVTFEGGSSIYTVSQVAISVNHRCLLATFASTLIASKTQYSKIEFSSALFTTTPSGCAITYEISSVNTGVSTPLDLSPWVYIGDLINFKIKPVVSTAYAKHQFFLKGKVTSNSAA